MKVNVWRFLVVFSPHIHGRVSVRLRCRSVNFITLHILTRFIIVVNYFGSDSETPIHHSLHNLKEEVPPNLSLRIKRKAQNASVDWTPIVTILDYEIVSGGSSGQLLKFD